MGIKEKLEPITYLAFIIFSISFVVILLSCPASAFDFANDTWDSTRYASPVAQYVAELNTPDPSLDLQYVNGSDVQAAFDNLTNYLLVP